MERHFRIHPAIGVARVGDAPGTPYVGPEHSGVPANWVKGAFRSFRDDSGQVLRQAARFRVFEYVKDDAGHLSAPKEITLGTDIEKIEWRVHVANKKAAFYSFDGLQGEDDGYKARHAKLATDLQKDSPRKDVLRNSGVPADQREALLVIDPGEKLITTGDTVSVPLKNLNTNIPFIPDLGELQVEPSGFLLFVPGHGTSGSTENPRREMDEYANNDTWFDDMSDGSIKARIFLAGGSHVDADAAWVLVGPPDFVPGIGNVVSLYDTLWDLAVRELPIPSNSLFEHGPLSKLASHKQFLKVNAGRSLDGYRPSFGAEVYPMLARAFRARWVFTAKEKRTFHVETMVDFNACADATDGPGGISKLLRDTVGKKLRDPRSTEPDWENMPRGHGDDYGPLDDGNPNAKSFLSLTLIQYSILKLWQAGEFDSSDWSGDEPSIDQNAPITPDGLDKAALENCVGGPFYPGIEVGWLIRQRDLYSEPFRLDIPREPESRDSPPPKKIGVLDFGPGFFSQQMALPWQADFYDCHKEEHQGPDSVFTLMWWTAQRPDDVIESDGNAGDERVRWVRALDDGKTPEEAEAYDNNDRFHKMQEQWSTLRFIVGDKALFREEEKKK